jgi:hypothetical protein
MENQDKCTCPHHRMIPIFVFLLGLTFLLESLHVLSPRVVAIVWPSLLCLIGLQKFFSIGCKCCSAHD